MGILTLILNFLGGGVVQSLADAFKAKEAAKTDQARIAADERIAKLQNIRDVQVAEAGSRINAIMRAAIAVGPTLYLLKIFVVDKLLCSTCSTDPLSPELWQVVTYVLGFYFLAETATGVTRIIKRK